MKLTLQQVNSVIDAFNSDPNGNRIAAIKALRQVSDMGLKEAKDALDKHTLTIGNNVHGFKHTLNVETFKRDWLDNVNPLDLIAEFAVHVRKLEQIIAQFAELCDHEGTKVTE